METEKTDFDRLLDALEPTATKGQSEWPDVLQASQAVSLKRIADLMEVRKGEANYQAFCEEAQPDGTVEGLERSASMLEQWAKETFPANEDGKVHFGRAMMDTVAAEIRAFLANFSKVTTSDA